jgi:hypothetical protein
MRTSHFAQDDKAMSNQSYKNAATTREAMPITDIDCLNADG